ncbi:hypothetical protein LR48_Vigan09g006300 [Vigna angularis]|uniref:(+)RNA virus helicase C-terminal domain-containing protein n=1 Tax=Phaseolus angularis TaxID=3914 RepID=A0A0L9V9T9_PHAAN|nr:hypothetical protein LR48_Vigan09g006300 [Vigna angularis]
MDEDSAVAEDLRCEKESLDALSVNYAKLPERPSVSDDDTFATKAKKEYVWYLQCKIISYKSTMMDIIREHVYGLYHDSEGPFPKNAAFLKITRGKGSWLYKKPKILGHMYAVKFDKDTYKQGGTLVRLQWEKDDEGKIISDCPRFPESENAMFMVCDHTYLMNELEILEVLKTAMNDRKQRHMPCITLIDGVPGCGKSTHIVKEASLNRQYVLTMGKEAALDLKARFKKERNATEAQLKRVRTVDSFFLNDSKSRAGVLHFDEALMAHAGMVYFCADMLSARIVICQGDSQQIPFVNRVEAIDLRYSELQISNTVEKRLTYRSPLDVASYLTKKKFYGNSIVMSANDVTKLMKVFGPRTRMSSIYSVPKIEGAHYLTFTQVEKDDMQKYLGPGKWGVNTIHESQGKTYDSVILVRLKATENEIYPSGRKSNPYIVVVPDVGEIQALQDLHDLAFPGNSTISTYFDGYEVASGGLTIDIDNLKINPHKQMKIWTETQCLEPVLRTAMPEKRQSGLVESVLALNKRNMATPNLFFSKLLYLFLRIVVPSRFFRLRLMATPLGRVSLTRSSLAPTYLHFWWRIKDHVVLARPYADAYDRTSTHTASHLVTLKMSFYITTRMGILTNQGGITAERYHRRTPNPGGAFISSSPAQASCLGSRRLDSLLRCSTGKGRARAESEEEESNAATGGVLARDHSGGAVAGPEKQWRGGLIEEAAATVAGSCTSASKVVRRRRTPPWIAGARESHARKEKGKSFSDGRRWS